jgi:hypothetical protein
VVVCEEVWCEEVWCGCPLPAATQQGTAHTKAPHLRCLPLFAHLTADGEPNVTMSAASAACSAAGSTLLTATCGCESERHARTSLEAATHVHVAWVPPTHAHPRSSTPAHGHTQAPHRVVGVDALHGKACCRQAVLQVC